MKNLLFLFLSLMVGSLSAQKQIHIKYLNVRSPIANVYEDLYTDGINVLSKQDGNVMYTNSNYANSKKGRDFYFISKLLKEGQRDFFFTEHVDGDGDFFIHDKVPQIEWKIDEETTKKVLGYNCFKATGVFRGSALTAYFTKDIPYSVGPFKFFGLPGAILDIRADGKNYDLWKAVKVDINDNTKINYTPDFPEFTKINMKDFIKLKDRNSTKFAEGAKVPGSTGKVVSVRLEVEKTFEWESEPHQ